MASTRLVLLEALSRIYGDWWSQLTTAAGSATTIVDSKLAQLSADDDFCLNWYVRNLATGQIRRISAYVASSTTITHASMTAVGDAATYELHRIDPDLKHTALLAATEETFADGMLWLPLRNETLLVDNLLSNPDMETAGAAPPVIANWTAFGAGVTITQEATRIIHGSKSAKIVAGAGAAGGVKQDLFSSVNIHDVAGKTLTFRAWVWASVASKARSRVTFDGSTYTNGPYHGGSSEWEDPGTQYIQVTVPTTATEMTVLCEAAAGATAYFDLVWAVINPVYRYTIPSAILRGPHFVNQQYAEHQPAGPFFPLGDGYKPIAGRLLRLEGMGALSQPTTDAGTIEVDAPQTRLLLAYAARYLTRAGVFRGGAQQRGRLQEDMGYWTAEIERMTASPAYRMPRMGAQIPVGWHSERDSSGRYIVLDMDRG